MGDKPKFDGYAAQYDEWFMKNEHLFSSELSLFKKALGDITGKKLLSVGCGSGLFESYIDSSNIEGIEPSVDMGEIAEKRGVNVISTERSKKQNCRRILTISSISTGAVATWKN